MIKFYVGDIVKRIHRNGAEDGEYRVQHDDLYVTPVGTVPIWRVPFVRPLYAEPDELQLIRRPWINRLLSLLE